MPSNYAQVLNVQALANQFSQVTLKAPLPPALAGQFVYLNEHPLYILAQREEQIDFIFPPELPLLERYSLSSLQGQALKKPEPKQYYLITAENNGLSACLFYLKTYKTLFNGLVIIGDQEFPFIPCPSQQLIKGFPPEIIAALPLLEDWGIANRLASLNEKVGVFHGAPTQLATIWLNNTLLTAEKIHIPAL